MTGRLFPSSDNRLFAGGIWALAGLASTILIGLVSTALLTRMLSPDDTGRYFVALTVVSFAAVAGSLGLNQAVVRLLAENLGLGRPAAARRVISLVYKTGVPAAIAVALLYLWFGGAVGRAVLAGPNLRLMTSIMAAWILLATLQNLAAESFRGFSDIRLASLFVGPISPAALVIGLGLVWLWQGRSTLFTVLALVVATRLVTTFMALVLFWRRVRLLPVETSEGTGIELSEVLRVALPLLVANMLLLALVQSDLWVIAAFRPHQEAAIYGVATRAAAFAGMPSLILGAVLAPFIAETYARGAKVDLERRLRGATTLAVIPSLLVLGLFVLWGGPLLRFFYGEYYGQGARVAVLLSLGYAANVAAGPCGLVLMMTGQQTLMMLVTGVCAALTVGMMLLLVSPHGMTGVAGAAAAGLALQNLALWMIVRIRTGIYTHVSLAALPQLLRNVRQSTTSQGR